MTGAELRVVLAVPRQARPCRPPLPQPALGTQYGGAPPGAVRQESLPLSSKPLLLTLPADPRRHPPMPTQALGA
eukprot:11552863-Alexandrium_andersonii.AAC.1